MLKSSTGVSPVLPAEYQQVEWIRSPSINDYIITDIPTNANGILHAVFSSIANNQFSFGNTTGSQYKGINIYNDLSANYVVYPSKDVFANYTDGSLEITATLNNGVATGIANGNQFSARYNVGDTTPYSIFRCNAYTNTPNYASSLKELSFQIDGGITHNFVPCYRKSDGVIGLYNTGNNVFYTNVGTGTFTKGADV